MSGKYSLSLVDKQLRIDALPQGSQIYSYASQAARRLLKIRLGEKLLADARQALDEWGMASRNTLLQEAIVAYASGNYFACFQSGELSPKFDARKVYGGQPDALDRHNEWLAIRHRRFHHPSVSGRSLEVGVLCGPDGKFLDAIVLAMDLPIGQSWPHIQLLYQLICETQKFAEEQATRAQRRIEAEFAALAPEDSKKLKKMEVNRPGY